MAKDKLLVDIECCHKDAELPEYQNEGDAGMDLKAVEKIKDTYSRLWFRTGLKIAIPRGYVGLIYPRSSITETNLELGNSVGVIDSGYRGEIEVRFNKNSEVGSTYQGYSVGDRVAQLIIMPYPSVEFLEVNSLNFDSDRGSQGFGSTDDK